MKTHQERAGLTMRKQTAFINSFPEGNGVTGKRQIAYALKKGLTEKQLLKQGFCQAYITMVINAAYEGNIKLKGLEAQEELKTKKSSLEINKKVIKYQKNGKTIVKKSFDVKNTTRDIPRNAFIKAIKSKETPKGNVFYLPSDGMIPVKKFAELKGWEDSKIFAAEIDPKVMKLQDEILEKNPKIKQRFYRGSFPVTAFDKLRDLEASGGTLSVCELDFCTGLNSNKECIELVLNSDLIVKGGVVQITICSRGGRNKLKESFGATLLNMIKASKKWKFEPIEGFKESAYNSMGTKQIPIYKDLQEGQDGRDASSMYVCIIRKVKK